MKAPILTILLVMAATSLWRSAAIPANPAASVWRRMAKRSVQTAPAVTKNESNPNTIQVEDQNGDEVKPEPNMAMSEEDELIEDHPDSPLLVDPDETFGPVSEDSEENGGKEMEENDSNSDRSIDWQLLNGNPADLERELENRRRRRSVRSISLSRQHRIRNTGRVRRAKRNTYSTVDPTDLMAAYQYWQTRRQEEDSDRDLTNLASLIYQLPRNGDDGEGYVMEEPMEEDQSVLPGAYVELEPILDTGYQPEIRMTPDQLAALESVLSQQEPMDEDRAEYIPKDKRSELPYGHPLLVNDDDETDEDEEQPRAVYLIPSSLSSAPEYVQVPVESAYQNPYDFYQTDDDPRSIEDAARLYDQEQLRQRIANLVDEINQQRRMGHRR